MQDITYSENDFSFTDKPLSKLHKFYLSGPVKTPDAYVTWFETIRTAAENDVIVIHINSEGGNLFTAIQFLRVLKETRANTIASVEGACLSAATVIFLAAKNYEISQHSMFMFHNYSNVMAGKGGELYDNIVHDRKWSETFLRDIYTGFLTAEEISSILNNKDIWLTAEEVTERLKMKLEIEKNTKEETKDKAEEPKDSIAEKTVKEQEEPQKTQPKQRKKKS